jgi:hypothetical protein
MLLFKSLKLITIFIYVCLGTAQASDLKPSDFAIKNNTTINIFHNFNLNQVNPNIERAVIVIHGVARNADEYFEYALTAAVEEKIESQTLIVAPHFKIDSDPLKPRELYWKESWKFGDLSHSDHVSSYEVIDKLIEDISSKTYFPNLKKLTVIGHSAGGQFVARYAAGSQSVSNSSLPLFFVVANPSSYLYFSPERWVEPKGFSVPNTDCTEYDSYPYGTLIRNTYMSKPSSQELGQQFNNRNVFLLLGEEDHLTDYLDMSCEANLQGKDRFERGMNFFRFIKTFYPKSLIHLKTVKNVGHSGEKMIRSAEAKKILFH